MKFYIANANDPEFRCVTVPENIARVKMPEPIGCIAKGTTTATDPVKEGWSNEEGHFPDSFNIDPDELSSIMNGGK